MCHGNQSSFMQSDVNDDDGVLCVKRELLVSQPFECAEVRRELLRG
jgi:hypothetical protein